MAQPTPPFGTLLKALRAATGLTQEALAERAGLSVRGVQDLERGQAGVSPETLAYHFARAGMPETSVRYLERAGDHAWAQRAHVTAEGHYRQTEAILYVRRTGCAWADLPTEWGDDATAYRRWRAWRAAGLWEQIAAITQTPVESG